MVAQRAGNCNPADLRPGPKRALIWPSPSVEPPAAMQIDRLSVQYVADADRLLMRVGFDGESEARLWLTRRLVMRFWPALIKLAEAKPDISAQPNPAARQALVGMEHEKALREVSFTKSGGQSEPERKAALGDEPLLVTRINARRAKDGHTVIAFAPTAGASITLRLQDRLLHGYMKLLQTAVDKAEWQLPLKVPGADGAIAAATGPLN
jgi:hypothetical protein